MEKPPLRSGFWLPKTETIVVPVAEIPGLYEMIAEYEEIGYGPVEPRPTKPTPTVEEFQAARSR